MYLHFGNRAALLVEMTRRFDRTSGFMRRLAATRSLPPRDGFRRMLEEWLRYGSEPSLAFYIYREPKKAKSLHLGLIPRAVDEYWQFRANYLSQAIEQQLGNPVHHIHGGKVPEPKSLPLTYGLLLNLVSLPGIHDKETAWRFVQRYAPDTSADTHAELDELIGLAVNYARDFVVPALKLTVHFKHPAGIITIPQIKNLARYTGTVNSDTFLTFAPGEVLLLGAKGSEGSDTESEVAYELACSENLQNKVIGGITVAQKQGWDVYWIQFKNDAAGNQPVTKPEYIYVERVYDRIPFAASLGFGG